MTIVTLTTPKDRLTLEQRRALALSLTDAVLVPEVGQTHPAARIGFQVHFVELDTERMAIGGKLLVDAPMDVMTVDVAVMEAAWPLAVRKRVIEGILRALAEVCGLDSPAPTWWVNFRVIGDGSWGSRGSVLHIADLLDSGVFTEERIVEIRDALRIQRPARLADGNPNVEVSAALGGATESTDAVPREDGAELYAQHVKPWLRYFGVVDASELDLGTLDVIRQCIGDGVQPPSRGVFG